MRNSKRTELHIRRLHCLFLHCFCIKGMRRDEREAVLTSLLVRIMFYKNSLHQMKQKFKCSNDRVTLSV